MRTLAMGKPHNAVLSAFVAFVLAFTLIPLPAYAEEAETNPVPNGEPIVDAKAVTEEAADNIDENKYTVTKIDEAATQDRVNMSVPIDSSSTSAPALATQDKESSATDADRSATAPALATNTIFSQDGMLFQVTSDTEAAFVGGNVGTNKLAVPATVKSGNQEYTVTAIACTATAAKEASAALAYVQKAEAVAAQGTSKAVETIVVPKTVTAVDAATFAAYPNAKSIQVAKDNSAFASVNGMLMSKNKKALIAVPEGLTGTAKLPSSLQEIPEAIFARANKVTAIALDKGDSAYTTYEGALYTADKKVLVAAPAGIGTSIKTAKECTTIIEGALFGNDNLKTIIAQGDLSDVTTAPEADVAIKNVKDIAKPGETIEPEDGKSGFAFTLTDDYTLAVKWAGSDAAPAVVNVPDFGTIDGVSYTVTALADNAFDGQKAVETVNIPNTVNTIGKRALAGTSLKSIVISSNIKNIEDEAFAELDGTNIVVVNAAPAVAESATKASENLNIYVPYVKGADYGWKTGLPATGNHICPYGVKFATSVYSMKAGETVDLYAGDGYWLAPGAVVTNYTYKAKYVSVDPTTGKITAKQNGSSALDVTLSIKVEETTETGTQTRDISLEPAAFGNASNNNVVETGTVQRDVATLGDTATVEVNGTEIKIYKEDVQLVPAARIRMNIASNRAVELYGTQVTGGSTQVSVDAPTSIVFAMNAAGTTGYDPATASNSTQLTSNITFTNNNPKYAAQITNIAVKNGSTNNAVDSSVLGTTNADKTTDLFSIVHAGTTTTFGTSGFHYNKNGGTGNSTTKIQIDKGAVTSGWSLKLNLADKLNTSQVIDSTTNLTANLGTLVYTFATITGPSTDDGQTSQPTGFWFRNLNNNKYYTLDQITAFSNAIEEENSTTGELYKAFYNMMKTGYGVSTANSSYGNSKGYECGVTDWGDSTKSYQIMLIGVMHDTKAGTSNKTGFTFQFRNCISTAYQWNTSATTTQGWSQSWLRARMNPSTHGSVNTQNRSNTVSPSATDDDVIWNQVPSALQTAIKPVTKTSYYGANGSSPGTKTTTNDCLFLPSYNELHSKNTYSYANAISAEGTCYAAYDGCDGSANNTALVKKRGDSGSAQYWWERSVMYSSNWNNYYNQQAIYVGSNGNPNNRGNANNNIYVSPCFCL